MKIEIEMTTLLKLGAVANMAGKKYWLEYKYERLPHYYYTCGQTGHYTSHCAEFLHANENMEDLRYGFWVKAETRDIVPVGSFFMKRRK